MTYIINIPSMRRAQEAASGESGADDMLARALAERLARHGIHYGWVIVAVTFLTTLTTAGAMGLPGALIIPLSKEFGWDVAQISSAIAIRLVLFGLMAPIAAALIESYGVQRVVIAAICFIVSGLLLALTMTHVWHLVVLWGIVVGIGTGMTALVLGAIIATRWFVARSICWRRCLCWFGGSCRHTRRAVPRCGCRSSPSSCSSAAQRRGRAPASAAAGGGAPWHSPPAGCSRSAR